MRVQQAVQAGPWSFVLAVVGAVASPADAQLRFGPVRGLAAPQAVGPLSWGLHDLDGDGLPEIPFAQLGKAGILGNQGDGLFAGVEWLGTASQPFIADVDGDGRPDLVVSGPGAIGVQLALPGGGYGAPVSSPTSGAGSLSIGAETFLASDVDGDGHVDLLAHMILGQSIFPDGAEVQLLAGDGTGHFAAPQVIAALPHFLSGVRFFDLEGDGDVDVLLTTPIQGYPHPLLVDNALLVDQGGGNFVPVDPGFGPDDGVWIPTDANGDGLADLVKESDGLGSTRLGLGGGAFAPPMVAYADAGLPPRSRRLDVDVDGDGRLDLVRGTVSGIEVWLGGGDGTYTLEAVVAADTYWFDLELGDLNDDGRVDLLFAATLDGKDRLAVALNTSFPPEAPFADQGDGLLHPTRHVLQIAKGDLVPGGALELVVSDPPPAAVAWLVLGAQWQELPFAGGVLGPSLDHVIGPTAVAGATRWSLGGAWPADVPVGTRLYSQFWVREPTGAFSSTGTVEITAP